MGEHKLVEESRYKQQQEVLAHNYQQQLELKSQHKALESEYKL